MVLPSAADASDSIRVRYAEDNPCCIRSKPLLDCIRTVAPQLNRSHLLRGKLLAGQLAVSFDMNEAETIEGAE